MPIFHKMRCTFSCELTLVLFSCKITVNTASVESHSTWFSTQKIYPLLSKSLAVHNCNTGLLSLYSLDMDCFHQLMVSSLGHVKTNKYINIQTYKRTLFGKHCQETRCEPLAGLQAHACLKVQYYPKNYFTWLIYERINCRAGLVDQLRHNYVL